MAPVYVVNSVSGSAPTKGNPTAKSTISYYYADAKIQAAGRGLLGFAQIKTVDEQTLIETTTHYRQDFPFIGHPLLTEVKTTAGVLISKATNNWKWNVAASSEASYQPYLERSEQWSYAATSNSGNSLAVGGLQSKVITESTYTDTWGNPSTIRVTTRDDTDAKVHEKLTSNTYGPTDWDKQMGRLTQAVVTTDRFDGNGVSTRTSSFVYHAEDTALEGLLKEEIIEPGSNYELKTVYGYDQFGNKDTATQTGTVGAGTAGTRFAESLFTTDGRYPVWQKNHFGQMTEKVVSRNGLGQPTQVEDINGVLTQTAYGRFGRSYFTASVTGAYSQTLLENCDANCPSGVAATYLARTQQAGGGESKVYYDLLAREVRRASRQFDGSWAFVDTQYDNLGRVVKTSEPYGIGDTLYWTTITYDLLGRVTSSTAPDTSLSKVSYVGLTTTTTNPASQTKQEDRNVLGELTQVIDNDGGKLTYQYDADGNLIEVVQDPTGAAVTIIMGYDLLGRKISMDDPDKGVWAYQYNAFGELELQTDAKNQTSTLVYDALGRTTSRVDRKSGGAIEGNTQWVYNNATSGSGLGGLGSVADSVSGYIKLPSYDSFGRVIDTMTSFAANDDHSEMVTYDEYGRVFQNFDAAGDGSGADNATQTHYNPYGYLQKISDALYENGVPKTDYYTVLEMDQRGNVTKAKHGNEVVTWKTYEADTGRLSGIESREENSFLVFQRHAYQWDALGNLLSRTDTSILRNLSEVFAYDNLNRITSALVTDVAAGTSQLEQKVTYDSLGNIASKVKVGSFDSMGNYTYGAGAAGPHAVTSTSNGVTYSYDANGNMTSDSSGRSLVYTTFDKPSQISKGGHTTTFKYGAGRARYMRTDNSGSGITTTRYIGNVEKITRPDGSVDVKRYLGNVMITLTTPQGSGTTTRTEYLLKDHLGSIEVILDNGTNHVDGPQVMEKMDFDAWGARRHDDSWALMTNAEVLGTYSITSALNTYRGFTGHEMLDAVGLIHMGGRVFDAKLGRFIQADAIVDGVTNTQGYNRYSYVYNNPLNATDPSGHAVFTLAAAFILAAEGVKDAYIIAAVIGAASFTDAMVQGASFGDAVLAGVSAAALSYVGGTFAPDASAFGLNAPTAGYLGSMGVIGGITSVLQGGKFGHGFAAAGLGSATRGIPGLQGVDAGPTVKRTLVAAIVGGTSSRISGGKFANGAAYSAMSAVMSNFKYGYNPKAPPNVAMADSEVPDGIDVSNMDAVELPGFGVDTRAPTISSVLEDMIFQDPGAIPVRLGSLVSNSAGNSSFGNVSTGAELGLNSRLHVKGFLANRVANFRFANDLFTAANNYVASSPACYNVVCGSITTAVGATTSFIDASYSGNYSNAALHSATGVFLGRANGTLGAAYDSAVHLRSINDR